MSRVGKKPIEVPEGVKVTLEDKQLVFSGKNGELKVPILKGVGVKIEGGKIIFSREGNTNQAEANWGTMRALANNALLGSEKDFLKELKIEGIGFRAAVEGSVIVLSVGFSHPVKLALPPGIKVSVEKNIIKISGPDKFLVGETAANIRRVKKPEPYLGKGIMYLNEKIRRKAGKKAASSTAS
jgi:large subunit ribosomal protein L6